MPTNSTPEIGDPAPSLSSVTGLGDDDGEVVDGHPAVDAVDQTRSMWA